MNESMATHIRLNISLHPNEINKLDEIRKNFPGGETRSGMIARLIQDYDKKK